MKQNHPIDELFQELAVAEVAPPASVWDKIAVQQSWSSRLSESLRKYWWVPLLFLFFTGAGIGTAVMNSDTTAEPDEPSSLSAHSPQDMESAAGFAMQSSDTESVTSSDTDDEIGVGHSQSSASTDPLVSTGDSEIVGSDAINETLAASVAGGPDQVKHIEGNSSQRVSTGGTGPAPSAVLSAGAAIHQDTGEESRARTGSPSFAGTGGLSNDVESNTISTLSSDMMSFRAITMPIRVVKRSSPRGDGKVNATAGSIPPGDWWVGGSIAYHNLSLEHDGTNHPLRDALNDSETGDHAISVEMLAGRVWRNGFFLSAGIGTETFTSDFAFKHSQFSPLDSTLVSLATITSTNRYNMFRIPVSGGWFTEIGRFEIGPRVGLIAEFGTSRKGYTVDRIQNSLGENGLVVVDLEDPSVNARYGSGISGVAAVQVGFKLSEFWSIWASPEFATRLATFGNEPLELTAERLGARFGFRYVIPY